MSADPIDVTWSRHFPRRRLASKDSADEASGSGAGNNRRDNTRKLHSAIKILPEVAAREAETIQTRRRFHKRPELKFKEVETSRYIATKLREADIEVQEGLAITGVVGFLQGGHPGPCIAIRADIDALPLQEEVDIECKSEIDGVMHACGHDAHAAILLCAAQVLAAERRKLHGSVKFIFQPGEEGGGGADKIIKDGVLEMEPKIEEIYALHVASAIPTGVMAVGFGNVMSSVDSFRIELKGDGGHGAQPHATQDLVLAASQLTTQLNTLIPRTLASSEHGVLTICRFQMGTTYNVIPVSGSLWGTLRTYTNREEIIQRIEAMVEGMCVAHDIEATFLFDGPTYPALKNESQEHFDVAVDASEKIVSKKLTVTDLPPSTASEDFSYFLEKLPGCYFFIGCGYPGVKHPPGNHSAAFEVDERCLAIGASIWVQLVRDRLTQRSAL